MDAMAGYPKCAECRENVIFKKIIHRGVEVGNVFCQWCGRVFHGDGLMRPDGSLIILHEVGMLLNVEIHSLEDMTYDYVPSAVVE